MQEAAFPWNEYAAPMFEGTLDMFVDGVTYGRSPKSYGIHVFLTAKQALHKHDLWVGKWHRGSESPFFTFFKTAFKAPTSAPTRALAEVQVTIAMKPLKGGTVKPDLVKMEVFWGDPEWVDLDVLKKNRVIPVA